MKTPLFITVSFCFLWACTQTDTPPSKKVSHPSHKYHYVGIDTSKLTYQQTDYLPVYSDIYHSDGTKRFLLTSTVSIRNTSLTDAVYLVSADYNDSFGTLIKSYIDSSIMLLPLESIEFVVEENETVGGAGAHFIIRWGAQRDNNQMIIQGVMISTNFQQGISFVTESKTIDKHYQ